MAAALAMGATAGISLQVAASEQRPLNMETENRVVRAFADALERYFLVPEVGKQYAARLRARSAAGAYRGMPATRFAQVVTGDLQAIYPDGHLRLRAPSRQALLGAPSAAKAEQESPDTAIERAGWIADGVAYISFNLFPSSRASLAAVRNFLEEHSAAGALIIDVRTHGGGFTDEFDVLASYLYDRPTELIYLDTREAAFLPKPDSPTLRRIGGPPAFVRQVHLAAPVGKASPLSRAKVFVLTSGYTGSAAEHLALALKRTARATLVGDVTAGMGHFGRVIELPAGFSAVIPIGRPFDPSTGDGWEGTGVQPHIRVAAQEALYVALLRLGLPAKEARNRSAEWMPKGEMDRVIPLREKPRPTLLRAERGS